MVLTEFDQDKHDYTMLEEGERKKEKEMILKASKKLSINEIADLYDLDISYVNQIIKDSK